MKLDFIPETSIVKPKPGAKLQTNPKNKICVNKNLNDLLGNLISQLLVSVFDFLCNIGFYQLSFFDSGSGHYPVVGGFY